MRLLPATEKNTIVELHKEYLDGIVPVRELLAITNFFRCVKSDKDTGRVPLSDVDEKLRVTMSSPAH